MAQSGARDRSRSPCWAPLWCSQTTQRFFTQRYTHTYKSTATAKQAYRTLLLGLYCRTTFVFLLFCAHCLVSVFISAQATSRSRGGGHRCPWVVVVGHRPAAVQMLQTQPSAVQRALRVQFSCLVCRTKVSDSICILLMSMMAGVR